jgi:hypothetical protein
MIQLKLKVHSDTGRMQRTPSISARPPRAPHISASMGTPPRQNPFGISATSSDCSTGSHSMLRQLPLAPSVCRLPHPHLRRHMHPAMLPPLPLGAGKATSTTVHMLILEPGTIVSRVIDNWSRIGQLSSVYSP